MQQEAADRLWDAEILATSAHRRSDAPYLLQLLALEILLKRLGLQVHKKIPHGHNYKQLFCDLPAEQQQRIVRKAKLRMGPEANYSDMPQLLELFSRNFIRLRYPYEAYAGMSEDEYIAVGAEWIKAGAPVEAATFQYFPNELRGLLDALNEEE